MNLSEIRDRINSYLHGSFQAPSGVPSRDDELAELRDLMVEAAATIEALKADRLEMYLRLVRSRKHVTDLQGQLLAAETEIALHFGVMG